MSGGTGLSPVTNSGSFCPPGAEERQEASPSSTSSCNRRQEQALVKGAAHVAASGRLQEQVVEHLAGLLGGRDFVVLASRGGGYGAGTPREGWNHAEAWLPHGLAVTGLEPRFIAAELTLAEVTPAMADLIPLAAKSLAAAEQAIDGLWSPASALA